MLFCLSAKRYVLGVTGCMVASTGLAASLCLSQDREQRIRKHYQRAQEATLGGHYKEAEGEYQAILKLNPSLAEAHANLGIIYYLEFQYAPAAESFKSALRIRPALTRARLYLGLAEFFLGDYRNSIRSLEEALAEGLELPYGKLARTSLARDYLALDQTEQAITILKPLSEDYPQDADILYMLGKAYLRLSAAAAEKLASQGDTPRVHQMLAENFANQGKFKEAIDEYHAALSLDPKLAGMDYPLGLLLLHEGQTEEGQRHLAAALRADPENSRIRQLLDQSRANSLPKALVEEALVAPSPGTERAPTGFVDPIPAVSPRDSSQGPLGKVRLLYARGEYDAVVGVTKELALHNPQDVDALFWLVKSYQALSVGAFGQIAERAPDSPRAHQLLAEGYEKQERFWEAVEEYEQALRRDPRLPGIHYAAGLARLRLGQWAEARQEFESELALDSFNAGANFRLGQLAYRDTNYAEAGRCFSRAIEIYPEFGEARAQLGQVLIKKGQYQAAVSQLLAAAKLLSRDPTIHFQLFHAYRALGEKALAQQELEIFQRMENEKKQATLRKAAQSMEQTQKGRKARPEPAGASVISPAPPPP